MINQEPNEYDLNIYRKDLGNLKHSDAWYIDIYLCVTAGGATSREQIGEQIELTGAESTDLNLGEGYFSVDNDFWYGLDLFLEDYEYQISDRLWGVFNGLPR